MKLCKDCKWCDLKVTAHVAFPPECVNPKNYDKMDLVYGGIGTVARSKYCEAQRAYDGPCTDHCGKAGHWFESREK